MKDFEWSANPKMASDVTIVVRVLYILFKKYMFLKSNRLVENFQTFTGGLRVEFQAEFHHEETYELSSKWNASMPRAKFQAECHHK